MADQARANADARYSGLFGKMRFNRDQKRLQGKGLFGDFKNDEKRAYIQQAVVGEQMNRTEGLDYDTARENNSDWYEEPEYDPYTGERIY